MSTDSDLWADLPDERTVADPLPPGAEPGAGERTLADPPEESWDGHDHGPELSPEEVDALVGPVGEDASEGTVAITEDWLLAPPDRARELVDALRVGLLSRVRTLAADGAAARTTAGRRPVASDLVGEALTMSRAYELLSSLQALFADLSREAAGTLTDAMQDHLGERKKSVKVATPDGGQVSIALAPGSTGISVDEEAVLDIVGTATIAAGFGSSGPVPSYPDGVRDGIAALRACLGSSPGFTTTKLGELVKELQLRGESGLAARLEGSYARVEKGEPRPKLTIEYGEEA